MDYNDYEYEDGLTMTDTSGQRCLMMMVNDDYYHDCCQQITMNHGQNDDNDYGRDVYPSGCLQIAKTNNEEEYIMVINMTN